MSDASPGATLGKDERGNETAAARLLEHIEGIERELDLKAEIEQRIKDRKAIAKGEGFDIKTMTTIIRERRTDAEKIAQEQALLDVYRAALGMLDGTPLGDYTRRKIDEELRARRGDDTPAPDDAGKGAAPKKPVARKPPGGGGATMPDAPGGVYRDPDVDVSRPAPAPDDLPADEQGARELGRTFAKEGRSLMLNPFPAGDRRRAAFDEAWCQEMQSDGMDLPSAFRRPKKDKDAKADAAKKPEPPAPDSKGPGR